MSDLASLIEHVEPYGGQWMPWFLRPSRVEIIDAAIARLRDDLAALRARKGR